MAVSKAQREATNKYLKEKVEEIKIRVPKGKKEKIQEYATSLGKSTNEFINNAIDEKMGVECVPEEAPQEGE